MTISTPATDTTGRTPLKLDHTSAGIRLVAVVAGLLLIIVAPVIIQGGLLGDDYFICLRPVHEGGYRTYLDAIWRDTGIVRPARFIELFLISKTCTSVPYGLVMLVPLGLKFAAGFLLYLLLRDLVPTPWPEVGTALWLLEPVGTEAALWPAALHVHLALVLALAALRLFRRGSLGWGAAAGLGAALSVEQVIFALPLAVWLTTPKELRRRSALVAAGAMTLVIVAYATWPGANERQALTLVERLHTVLAKREWYLFFPAAGLGLYSGAHAFVWALPLQHRHRPRGCLDGLLRGTAPAGGASRASARARCRGSRRCGRSSTNRARERSADRHPGRLLGADVYAYLARAFRRGSGGGGARVLEAGSASRRSGWHLCCLRNPLAGAERACPRPDRQVQPGGGAMDRRPHQGWSGRCTL